MFKSPYVKSTVSANLVGSVLEHQSLQSTNDNWLEYKITQLKFQLVFKQRTLRMELLRVDLEQDTTLQPTVV